ncbi:MAG: dihydrodipicolinate synthase family protein [Candidatus Heimdallarchaeota archaeon]|nr:dihydrodipicolinate synthase family protein [Candidatus Heimdallarchaeota archaeon]MBY8993468.1 dihydrodipicolinate synthase family protein [Candidatus Heimdallarchaeota archaeon]
MGKKFKGIGCPCVTPFDEDGALDLTKLRELIDFLINSEINAIIPASNCGESYTLTDTEYHLLIDTVIDQVNNAVPIYVGLPTESTSQILSIAKYATDAGVDGLVLYPPRIPSLTIQELVNHIELISSKVNCNLLVVNDPDHCKLDLSVELISKISKFNNVVGLVELSSDFKKIPKISAQVSDGFLVYTGRGLLVPQAIKEGGVEGAIVPSANVVPNLLSELYEAYNVEVKDRFEEIQTKLIPLEIGLKLGSFPAAIKAALNMLGISVGNPRNPISSLSEGDLEKLRNILISAGCLRPPATDEEPESTPAEKENKKAK